MTTFKNMLLAAITLANAHESLDTIDSGELVDTGIYGSIYSVIGLCVEGLTDGRTYADAICSEVGEYVDQHEIICVLEACSHKSRETLGESSRFVLIDGSAIVVTQESWDAEGAEMFAFMG